MAADGHSNFLHHRSLLSATCPTPPAPLCLHRMGETTGLDTAASIAFRITRNGDPVLIVKVGNGLAVAVVFDLL